MIDLALYLSRMNYEVCFSTSKAALEFSISDKDFGEKWQPNKCFPGEEAPEESKVDISFEVKRFKLDENSTKEKDERM